MTIDFQPSQIFECFNLMTLNICLSICPEIDRQYSSAILKNGIRYTIFKHQFPMNLNRTKPNVTGMRWNYFFHSSGLFKMYMCINALLYRKMSLQNNENLIGMEIKNRKKHHHEKHHIICEWMIFIFNTKKYLKIYETRSTYISIGIISLNWIIIKWIFYF